MEIYKFHTSKFRILLKSGLIISILIFLCSINAFSSSSIIIPDTIAHRGIQTFIPVTGSYQEIGTNELKIEFVFNSNILDIKSAKGGTGFIILDEAPQISIDFSNRDSSVLTLVANNIQYLDNSTYCMLEVEGLVFSDSIAYIKPSKIFSNGLQLSDFQMVEGQILVPGLPIYPVLTEGFGQNYPNPFNYNTIIPFFIKSKSTVSFSVFNIAGFEVLNLKENPVEFKLKKITQNGEVVIDNTEEPLDPGNYLLDFTPNKWEFSSGLYFVMLRTEHLVFSTCLIYSK